VLSEDHEVGWVDQTYLRTVSTAFSCASWTYGSIANSNPVARP
jgi:hypothetical protein